MAQWDQVYRAFPSSRAVIYTVHLYKPWRRHISSQEERRDITASLISGNKEGRAERKEQHELHWQTASFPRALVCTAYLAWAHEQDPEIRVGSPSWEWTLLSISSVSLLSSNHLNFCVAAASVIPQCHSLPTFSISRLSARDSFSRNVAFSAEVCRFLAWLPSTFRHTECPLGLFRWSLSKRNHDWAAKSNCISKASSRQPNSHQHKVYSSPLTAVEPYTKQKSLFLSVPQPFTHP